MQPYRVDFESMPWEQRAAGVRCKACERDGRRLRLAEFTKDFVEPDWCTNGHIGYVLKGRMQLDFRGKIVTFGPGDGLFIPPGTEHSHKARVLTDFVRVILVESSET
jgi:ethanolamine utilization protein EutQ (cupin superfamily)